MDPDEALRLYHRARARGDEEEAAEHADNLLTWLRGGGFRPEGFARADEHALRAFARTHGARGLGAYGAGAIDDPFTLSPEVAPSYAPVGGTYSPELAAPWESDPFFAVAPSSDPWMPSPVTYTPGEVLAAAPTGTPAPSGTLGDLWASTADKLAAAAKTPAPADVDVWLHDDSRGFGKAIPEAVVRALAGEASGAAWGRPDGAGSTAPPLELAVRAACVADLRALMIGSMYAVNLASKTPAVEVSPAVIGSIYPGSAPYVAPAGGTPPSLAFTPRKLADFEDPTVGAAAVALQLGWRRIAERLAWLPGPDGAAPPPIPVPVRYGTHDGNPALTLPAGALPGGIGAAGWPLAVGVVVASGAIAYLGGMAIAAYDRQLAREQDTRRLVGVLAATMDVIANHAEADRAAGKATPLTAAEMSVVSALPTLVDAYGEATKKAAGPLQPPGTGNPAGPEIGTTVMGVAAIAAVAVVAYLVIRK